MFVNGIEVNLKNTSSPRSDTQCSSDNDEDCSCSSCECSYITNENRIEESKEENISIRILNEQDFSRMNVERIYEIIDRSYTKISILYKSIKQTKLDTDFLISVNGYLDRLKSNIYKDLIRRETILRNGKNHARNFISLLRCIWKISYEQSREISNDFNASKHPAIYTMTAIDYILQRHFPQKKLLFNYILHEYISMWLHENLRTIQEDFAILVENGTEKNFFSLSMCLFNKLESICAINWERLQMIQNYRLTHFDQLIKPTSIELETNKEFSLLLGKSLPLTMRKSDLPITSLYANRTENELANIDQIHRNLRKCVAQILHDNLNEEDQKLISSVRERITSPVLITKSTSMLENPIWNIIPQTQTQPIESLILTRLSSADILKKRTNFSKLEASEHQPIAAAMKIQSKQSITLEGTSNPVKTDEQKYSFHQPISSPTFNNSSAIISRKPELQRLNTSFKSPEEDKPFTESHSPHSNNSDKSRTANSKAILNTEVNALIKVVTEPAHSPSSLVEQLDSGLKENKIDSNMIIEKSDISHSQLSSIGKDPLFSAEFLRVLRTELEDAQMLREIDRGHSNKDLEYMGYPSFETSNILKLPTRNTSLKKADTAGGDHIDQNRIFIEVTHDPSRCSPNSEVSRHQYHLCTPSPDQQLNHNCNHHIRTTARLTLPSLNLGSSKLSNRNYEVSSISDTQQSSLKSNPSEQRWYWICSNENSLSQNHRITANSLSCTEKSFARSSYSITIEHNEDFQ